MRRYARKQRGRTWINGDVQTRRCKEVRNGSYAYVMSKECRHVIKRSVPEPNIAAALQNRAQKRTQRNRKPNEPNGRRRDKMAARAKRMAR